MKPFRIFPIVLLFILSFVWAMALQNGFALEKKKFHFNNSTLNQTRALGYQSNALFSAAGICAQCHGHDDNGLASVDANGNDINVVDAWAATMMANSAKDPYWRAKVSHEVLVNPAHQNALEGTCVKCHAPMGKYNAIHLGLPYEMDEMLVDSVGLDGVSCGACHQQRDTLMGKKFSGELFYDTLKNVFGPYINPMGPMFANSGYNPVHSPHINHAGLCGSCHTLITETVDLSGVPTGDHFVEQATYHEWLNSDFNNETNVNGITCQGCHIPRTLDPIKLSTGPPNLTRTPFGKHELVGANVFMLRLMKNNISQLNLYSTAVQFDSVIARTERMLQQQTLELNLTETSRNNDSVFYELQLTNKAGHKFPSGYPSRRSYIEFVVRDENGDTLFASGLRNNNELVNQDPDFEEHYNLINSEQQVQIYEMVMGDVNSNVTTVLERGKAPLKDNRLPPSGFTLSHPAYDTCKIIGAALNDTDFNRNGPAEGTGADILHVHVSLSGYTGLLNVSAKVYYESVPFRFLQDMFSHSSAEIDLFENMYNTADKTPVLVAEKYLNGGFLLVDESSVLQLQLYPNPSADGLFHFRSENYPIQSIEVYDLSGRKIATHIPHEKTGVFTISAASGTYIVKIKTAQGLIMRKVVIH